MIDAIKLTIGNITYPNVKVLAAQDIIDTGLEPIFGDDTIMFKNDNCWHACHGYNVCLIQVAPTQLSIPGMIPFKRIVIDSDKIYSSGKLAPYSLLVALAAKNKWKLHMVDEIAFCCRDGSFISSSWDVSNIIMDKDIPKMIPAMPRRHNEITAAHELSKTAGKKLDGFIKKGGTKSVRSSRRHS
jgi:hypothetical protein